MTRAMVTAEEIREIVVYDPETGDLTWKPRKGLSDKASGWNTRYAGTRLTSVNSHGYIRTTIWERPYEVHRLIWLHVHGEWPQPALDHINGDKQDNRLSNLRIATVAQNGHNVGRTKRNASGAKGVYWHKVARKWQAEIMVNKRHIYLGLHPTLDAAREAYDKAARQHHGEFYREAA